MHGRHSEGVDVCVSGARSHSLGIRGIIRFNGNYDKIRLEFATLLSLEVNRYSFLRNIIQIYNKLIVVNFYLASYEAQFL